MLMVIGSFAGGAEEWAVNWFLRVYGREPQIADGACGQSPVPGSTDIFLHLESSAPELFDDILRSVDNGTGPAVILSRETGMGVVPVDRRTRIRREAAGQMNQRAAEAADTVVRVICGIPQVLKGRLRTADEDN